MPTTPPTRVLLTPGSIAFMRDAALTADLEVADGTTPSTPTQAVPAGAPARVVKSPVRPDPIAVDPDDFSAFADA